MQVYKTKTNTLPGTHWHQVIERALNLFKIIKAKTKRRPYIRSAYFDKEKIFLDIFWHHLHEKKSLRDKTRRLKFFPCAIELIQNSHIPPESNRDPNNQNEIWYRFGGITPKNERFFVQIKKRESGNQKWLISIFPAKK